MRKIWFVILLIIISTSLSAQNRIIVNPGFNEGDNLPVSGWADVESQLASSPEIDGWYTTHSPYNGISSPIEVWTNGFLGTPAQEGSHFVELNAEEPSRLYQIVYLVIGETIHWEYYHRNRPGGLPVQTIKYSIYSEDGSSELLVVDSYSNSDTTAWTHRSGAFTVPLSTGVYQIGFESTEGTSYGNLLDNVTIELDPIVEFTTTTFEASESSGVVPHLIINGKVENPSSVSLRINSSTASSPEDYSYSSLDIDVDVGQYGIADSIPIPITIHDDTDVEGDEDIELEIVAVTGDLLQQDGDGTGGNEKICSFTIVDDDFMLAEIVKFEALMSHSHVELIWESAAEVNCQDYIIEHSFNETDWFEIGKVKATGNSNIKQTYSYTHFYPKKGCHYYRLKQVDYDGKYQYSKPEKVDVNQPEIQLYPNPIHADDLFVSGLYKTAKIQVFNMLGKQQTVPIQILNTQLARLNLSCLQSGIYLVKVDDYTFKILKN
jgi:hypothetical protein